jgi:hypothetical protein
VERVELMRPSRRELLAAFLGTAAAKGCRRSAPELPGELMDRSMVLGHRLRGGPLPVAGSPHRTVAVAIVGAGDSGLSAAGRKAGGSS